MLALATQNSNTELVRILIEAGANLYLQTTDGWRALDMAKEWTPDRGDIIKLLEDAKKEKEKALPPDDRGKGRGRRWSRKKKHKKR